MYQRRVLFVDVPIRMLLPQGSSRRGGGRRMNTSYLLQEYFRTALWASVDENDEPLDKNYSFENISEESLMFAAEEIE